MKFFCPGVWHLEHLPVVEGKEKGFLQHRVETTASGVILAKAGRNTLCRISSSRKRETNFCSCDFPKKWRTEARGSLQSRRVTESKFLPRCQNPQFCGFAPRGKLVGECLPQTLLVVLADYISFTSAPARKFIHSVPRPLPTQPASLGLRGGPMSAAHERRSHHAKEIQHAPPQPRCENPAVRR